MANRQCAQMDAAVKMYKRGGKSIRTVAEKCGVSASGLMYALRRERIKKEGAK